MKQTDKQVKDLLRLLKRDKIISEGEYIRIWNDFKHNKDLLETPHYKNHPKSKYAKQLRKETAKEIFKRISKTSFIEQLNDRQLQEFEEVQKEF